MNSFVKVVRPGEAGCASLEVLRRRFLPARRRTAGWACPDLREAAAVTIRPAPEVRRGVRKKTVVMAMIVTLVMAGLITYAVVAVSKGEHPAAAANQACAQHGGVDRFGSEPSGGDFTVICRDHVAVDVSY